MDQRTRLRGALLGLALGDALGLPYEGLSARTVARRFDPERYRLWRNVGLVSDDTEQTVLLAEALVDATDDEEVERRFRRAMVGWLLRLPFGIGWGTLRACVRMSFGLSRPGVGSAGNGAAMRAGILGVVLADEPARRRRLGTRLARLTHTDARAVQAALYVTELAAACARSRDADRTSLVAVAQDVLDHAALRAAVQEALDLASLPLVEAAPELGNSGFAIHTIGLCTYCFLRYGTDPMQGVEAAVLAGGDTDTHAAIVGGWLGALHGPERFRSSLVERLQKGPFGRRHLDRLAGALADGEEAPAWSSAHAIVRNLALYPVVLWHGITRMFW